MKRIISAGGSSNKIYPLKNAVVKQLMSIYDKPIIFYAFSTFINTEQLAHPFVKNEYDLSLLNTIKK